MWHLRLLKFLDFIRSFFFASRSSVSHKPVQNLLQSKHESKYRQGKLITGSPRENEGWSSNRQKRQRWGRSIEAKKMNQVREKLLIGMRFFHDGLRTHAIPFLEEVLQNPYKVPSFRLSAACLLGETYRGVGDFEKAESYFEWSMKASEEVLSQNRKLNEWYAHYRPRAQIGLIFTLRRNLSNNHYRIKYLLKEAKDQFQNFPSQDIMAQLNLCEGLYYRQLGDFDGSIERIKQGFLDIKNLEPPYLFLHPEHFEALLLLSYLYSEENSWLASRLAKRLFRAEKGSWSTAIAAISLIHLEFLKVNDWQFGMPAPFEPEVQKSIGEWMTALEKNASFEKDPLLLTEEKMLKMQYSLFQSNGSDISEILQELSEDFSETLQPIVLLRCVELASIKPLFTKAIPEQKDLLEELLQKGLEILDKLSPQLKTYNCSEELINSWKNSLSSTDVNKPMTSTAYFSVELQYLRARVWS